MAEYQPLERICRTAGSELWRGRCVTDGAPVLLKLLPDAAPPTHAARFRREFEILRSLSVPGVARPVALIDAPGGLAIVLDEFAGDSLDATLSHRRFDLADALRIAIRLADILAGVHAAEIIHQDFRPANFLVSPDCRILLADVHLAARGNAEAPEELSLFPNHFDPAYISPEQTGRINRKLDYRTDFYSLGVTLYRLLTGRLPFNAGDQLEWVYCHVARRPRPPAEVAGEVPAVVSDLVMKLLAKEAEERYQSAPGLRFDLEQGLGQLQSTGRIVSFPLGAQDVSDRFRIPQKLYGRETELATLVAVFERMADTGWPEMVLVSGYSGTGKSSLVNDLRQSIVRRRGYFAAGKFDPFQRDVPYATLARALQDLLQQILAEREAEIAGRKERLQQALGVNGRLIADLIPQLALIIGPQPAVAELPPAEAQNRFHALFQHFVAALATPEHPLVIFLDDLQWLDAGSIKLVEYLLGHPETRHLLFIGAYREDEVSPSHPLLAGLETIVKMGVKKVDIVLRPLSPEHLNQLVTDTLRCAPEHSAPLAGLIFAKTKGNPFFSTQFLASLHRQGQLVFNREQRAWTWDLASIEAKSFTDNLTELIVGKLKRFGGQAEHVLQLAGCLGNTFELERLATIWGQSEEETEAVLGQAVQEGLLLRRGRTYRFLHDYVHQAACELIPGEQRAEVHLKIGRQLLTHTPPDALEERLFEVVTQLNLGAAFITSEKERARVAELNLWAARRAKAATAYQAAASYLAAGARLLGCDALERQDPLAFPIFLERTECEFLCGNFGQAESLIAPLLQHARTRLDRAAIYRLKIDTLTTEGKDEEAIESALECLRMFGIDISPHPSTAEVEKAYQEVWRDLGTRAIEKLIDLPLMDDPEMQAAMDILARLYAPAYHLDNNLFYLHLCHGVKISLRHGNAPASTHAYGWFGVLLTCVFQRPEDGYRFARLAFELMEKYRFLAYKARAIFVLRIISYWTQPLDRMLEYSRSAFDAAVETGDVPGACFSRNHTVMGMLLRGDHLAEVHREAERAREFVRRAGFRDVHDMIAGIERFVQAMQGKTRHLSTYDDEHFSEADFEAELAKDRMPTLLFYYYVVKLMARFLSGDYAAALAAGEKSRALLWAGLFSAQGHCFHFFHALTLAAVLDTLPPEERREALGVLATHREFLQQAAEVYPPTFHHTYALVSAEIARIEGRELEAERLYEEAIRSAKANGFAQNEAIANEAAGRFHLSRGFATIAEAYLRQARSCYARWGADGKVRQLETRHPQLIAKPPAPAIAEPQRLLDTLAIVKASQAISSEILLNRLLDTLMRNVMASAGARQGDLLLLRPEGLVLAAEAHADADTIDVQLFRDERDFASRLPAALLNYVRRSREQVLVTDAEPNPFAADEYFSRHSPKSVLCLPIVRRAELIGLLYLENDLVPNIFTPERLAVLDLLACQAAISLENALLYNDLREENAERRRAEEAVRENQRLLQSIIDNSTALIYVKDLEGRFLLVNRRLEELFGIVPGRTDYDFFSKDQANVYRAVDQRVIASGSALAAEEEAPLADGVHTYISIKAPLHDSSGRVYAVCGISTDITERKKAERHQSADYAIAGVLAGSATFSDAAPRLLQILCESLGWELGEVWIIDARAKLIRHTESWHVPTLKADKFIEGSRGGTFPRGSGLPGRVWQSGAPEWVADVTNDPEFARAAMAAEAGLHGAFAFPIMLGSQMLGVMAFFSREMRQPDEILLAMLTTIGSQIGQFVERKRTEEELHFSEARYRALHRDNPTMIFTLDTEGTVLSVNPFGANQLGFSIEELEGQPVLNVFHADDRPAVAEQLQKCLQNPNQVYRWHFRKVRKDGALLWVEELAQAIYGPEGALNVLVVCQDITERRRAEEARKNALMEAEAAREKVDAILKSVADGLLVTDLADRVVLMNETAEALLGIGRAGTSRQHIDSLLAEEALRRQIVEVRRGEQEKAVTEWGREADYGQMRVLQAQTTSVRNVEGRRTGTITALRDVTREREIDRMKDEFISTAAHELRTPLTTVMGYVELLLQNEQAFAPEVRREFLELVYRNSETLERLINDLLDLSTVQAGRLITLKKARVDLAALVAQTVTTWQGLSDRHQFSFEFSEAPVHLCLDAGKIGQVLENLLSNAVKFSPTGGTIRVRGHRTAGEFEVTVEDEGIGMRPEQVARIFDKFYRADASDTAVGGLGLGMSIVRNIVAAHGGHIWVESEPGRGTRVHFSLPGKDRAAECERMPS